MANLQQLQNIQRLLQKKADGHQLTFKERNVIAIHEKESKKLKKLQTTKF